MSILRRIFIIVFINYHGPKTLKKSLDEKITFIEFILCDAKINLSKGNYFHFFPNDMQKKQGSQLNEKKKIL